MHSKFLFILILIFNVPTIIADEVWNSNYGQIVYAKDVGVTAYWTYKYNGESGIIFIPGLAGIPERRGNYEGYWAQNKSGTRCQYARPGIDDEPTYYWGKFHIQFTDLNFPTRWTALWSYCEETPSSVWDGTPE